MVPKPAAKNSQSASILDNQRLELCIHCRPELHGTRKLPEYPQHFSPNIPPLVHSHAGDCQNAKYLGRLEAKPNYKRAGEAVVDLYQSAKAAHRCTAIDHFCCRYGFRRGYFPVYREFAEWADHSGGYH